MAGRSGTVENLVMNSAFWSGKKVFLTGHTGFKGSWLSLWLQKLGAEVTGYALAPPTEQNLFKAANVAEGMHSVIADIRDRGQLISALQQCKPDIVIHMAAQPLVRLSYADPVMTYETNVMGTVNLLDAIRQIESVRAVVNVTSDKCYENKEWPWGYRENEPMGGYDPYSNSKGCAELVTAAFRNSYFNPTHYASHGVAVASARAGNVIGGGDWAQDRLIPDILTALSRNEAVVIRSPKAIRPWQHVLEPLSGYLCLAEKLYVQGAVFAEGWNFGPQPTDAKPVEYIVEKLVQLWGDEASWLLDTSVQPHEAHYLKLDCSKANAQLHWHPKWSLDTTLQKIVTWQKAYLTQSNMQQITLSEISDYEQTS